MNMWNNASINNMNSNSKFSNKETLQLNPSNYTKLKIKWYKTSIYNYFELSLCWKVWITWNFELTMFKLTVQFNIEKIGKWAEIWTKLWIKGNFELTMFELAGPYLYPFDRK